MKCRLCGTAVEFDVLKSHKILCKEKENELLDGNEDGVEHILATPASRPENLAKLDLRGKSEV